jgi:hypothetical protein
MALACHKYRQNIVLRGAQLPVRHWRRQERSVTLCMEPREEGTWGDKRSDPRSTTIK